MRDPEFARKQIARYRLEKARCLETLRLIDERRVSFYQAPGDERPRETTALRRAEIEREISLYDELVELWGRDLASRRRTAPAVGSVDSAVGPERTDLDDAFKQGP